MMSPGLYSAVDAITSMPGAPERSARFCSTRCGESKALSFCAKSPVTTPAPKIAATTNGRADFLICMVPPLGMGAARVYPLPRSDKPDVGDPVALAAGEPVAHSLAVEGDRSALERRGLDVVQRVHADDCMRAAFDVARDDGNDAALAADMEDRGLGAERVLGDRFTLQEPDRERGGRIGGPHAAVLHAKGAGARARRDVGDGRWPAEVEGDVPAMAAAVEHAQLEDAHAPR